MPIEIQIPRLGWSMEEGTFTGWLKKEGEQVKSGEPLFTMESEKAAQDIEAIDDGILHIPADAPNQGDIVKVGQVIGLLLAEGESIQGGDGADRGESFAQVEPTKASKPESDSKESSRQSPPAREQRSGTAELRISPRARRRAEELGLDVSRLRGSGRTGRIVEADVLAAKPAASSQGISVIRRTIAQRTSASFSATPHFYLQCEVDATALVRLREDLLPEVEASTGVRLTLTDFILRAQSMALHGFPAANAIWVNEDIVRLPDCDVGLVVGLPDGLIIPIVRSPNKEDLAAVAKQRAVLIESARSSTLPNKAMQGGATSLSNLGVSRVDEFAAVIAPTQSTMLAVGRAALRPFVVNGRVAARTTMRLCLSVDHRVLDGAPASEFLGIILQLLEDPDKLV